MLKLKLIQQTNKMGDNSNRNKNTCSFYTNSANNKWEITQVEILQTNSSNNKWEITQTEIYIHAVYAPI